MARPISIRDIPKLPTSLPNTKIKYAKGFTNKNSHKPEDSFDVILKSVHAGKSSKSIFNWSLYSLYIL